MIQKTFFFNNENKLKNWGNLADISAKTKSLALRHARINDERHVHSLPILNVVFSNVFSLSCISCGHVYIGLQKRVGVSAGVPTCEAAVLYSDFVF